MHAAVSALREYRTLGCRRSASTPPHRSRFAHAVPLRIIRFLGLLLSATVGFSCLGNDRGSDTSGQVRNVAAASWDTLFIAGSGGVDDTLFARPHRVSVVGDLVLVGNGMTDRVIALDKNSGDVRWTFGRRGGAPTEFSGIVDIKAARGGTILVLDYGNGRVTELSTAGEFLGVRDLKHLPAPPFAILPLGDRAIAMSPGGGARPFMELGPDSFDLRKRLPLAWPDSIPTLANTELSLAEGSGNQWVSAFALGPGFIVWKGDVPSAHRYIDYVPFANRVNAAIRRIGADSARYGARSMSISADEIFMLFGGRPVRSSHPGEPTVWIDVYSLEGAYLRSYRLPFDTDAMAMDGSTFYLLASDDAPELIALRPKDTPATVR